MRCHNTYFQYKLMNHTMHLSPNGILPNLALHNLLALHHLIATFSREGKHEFIPNYFLSISLRSYDFLIENEAAPFLIILSGFPFDLSGGTRKQDACSNCGEYSVTCWQNGHYCHIRVAERMVMQFEDIYQFFPFVFDQDVKFGNCYRAQLVDSQGQNDNFKLDNCTAEWCWKDIHFYHIYFE
uniref:Uncharacterized protein n=1 Tax=Strigamia maritima TaxID=126957 RepID=T1IKP9_STRMM